jgi:hypothetical protein
MIRQRRFLAWCLTPFLVVAAHGTQAQGQQRSELPLDGPVRVKLAESSRLEIKGVNGEITLTRATGDEVVVSVARETGKADPQLIMATHDQGATICTVYPSSKPKSPNECLPGNKGRLAQGNPNGFPVVRFRVEIPDSVHFMGDLTLGSIKAEGVSGNLQLKTARGDISIADRGSASIQAEVGLLGNIATVISPTGRGQTRRINLKAIGNGQIRVALPTTLRVSYSIASQTRPTIDQAFKLEKALGPLLLGHWGPAGDSELYLTVDTGIAGRLEVRRAAAK